MKRVRIFLLLAVSGCAEAPSAPDSPTDATAEEQTVDPIKAGRDLIDRRETGDSLDRAIRLLEYHSSEKPQSAAIHILATEAYSRSLEALDDRKSQERDRVKRLLTKGKLHGDEAVRIEPTNGAALYWRACLLLHAADVEQSFGKAKEAQAQLEKAESLTPLIDEGGPARMRGRVYAEMPGLLGGSLSKAVECYQRSLKVAPNCITTHLWLGEAYVEGRKYDIARKELEWVLAAKVRPGHEKEDGADQKKAEEKLKALKK